MEIDFSKWEKYLPLLLMGAVYLLSQGLFKKKQNQSRTKDHTDPLNQVRPSDQDISTENDTHQYLDETNETFFEQVYGDSKSTEKESSPLDTATVQSENQQLNELDLFQKTFNIEEPSTETPTPSSKATESYKKKNQLNSYSTNLKKLSNSKNFKQAFILKELIDPPKSMR